MGMASFEDDPRRDARRPTWIPVGSSASASEISPEAPAGERDGSWLGRMLDGRFELVAVIGHGGMATVYRARESGLITRDVAIKLLSHESARDPTVIARFRREAQIITDIHHPHVVNVFHVGFADDQLYIVMELLRGQCLQTTLQEQRSLPWSRLAPMMLHACAALQAAHEQQIIHRDVKPTNCFRVDAIGNPDFLKVLDFGIAKAKQLPEGLEEGTRQGTFLGTPHYTAPEIIDPHGGPVDGRVDMFALGVVMYQCLTGSLPFEGARGFEALHHTVHSTPDPPRERAPLAEIPAAVEDLVMRTLARRPEDRFADMATLAAAIRRTTLLRAPPPLPRRVPRTRPEMPSQDTPGLHPTPPRQPSIAEMDEAYESSPTSPSGETVRPVRTTIGVLAVGVLSLLALLAYEAWIPIPAETIRERRSVPVPVPILVPEEEPPASTDLTTADVTTTDIAPIETTTTIPLPIAPATTDSLGGGGSTTGQDRQQTIVAQLNQPLAELALRCGIGIYDPWKLQVSLRIAPDGSVKSVRAPTRPLAPAPRRCLLGLLRARSFARGDGFITVVHTLRGGGA